MKIDTPKTATDRRAADVETLAKHLYDAEGWHAADSWATETSIIRGRYEGLAEDILDSDWLADLLATARREALLEAADDFQRQWPVYGDDWLRERAARIGGDS